MTNALDGKVVTENAQNKDVGRESMGRTAFEPGSKVDDGMKNSQKAEDSIIKGAQEGVIVCGPCFPNEGKESQENIKEAEKQKKSVEKGTNESKPGINNEEGFSTNKEAQQLKDYNDKAEKGESKGGLDKGKIEDLLDKHFDKGDLGDLENFMKHKVTDKDRNRAKEILADEISSLVPEGDQKALKGMQSALIDGDLKAFSKAVKDAGADPEKLGKLVERLNEQLEDNEKFGGVEVRKVGDDVYLYNEDGGTALKIDSKTGNASIHPIEHQKDGSIVTKPGVVLNRTAEDVMQSVGDEATESLTGKLYNFIKPGRPIKPIPKPWPPKGWEDGIKPGKWDGKGGGGGGDTKPGNYLDFLDDKAQTDKPQNYYNMDVPNKLK